MNTEALNKIASTTTRDTLIERQIESVKPAVNRICDYFNVSLSEVYCGGKRKPRNVYRARGIITWVVSENTTFPKSQIGLLFGQGWTATSVRDYLQKVEGDISFYRNHGKDINGTIKVMNDLNIEIK